MFFYSETSHECINSYSTIQDDEFYGTDWDGPCPLEEDADSVTVLECPCPLTDNELHNGIDLYELAVQYVAQHT